MAQVRAGSGAGPRHTAGQCTRLAGAGEACGRARRGRVVVGRLDRVARRRSAADSWEGGAGGRIRLRPNARPPRRPQNLRRSVSPSVSRGAPRSSRPAETEHRSRRRSSQLSLFPSRSAHAHTLYPPTPDHRPPSLPPKISTYSANSGERAPNRPKTRYVRMCVRVLLVQPARHVRVNTKAYVLV